MLVTYIHREIYRSIFSSIYFEVIWWSWVAFQHKWSKAKEEKQKKNRRSTCHCQVSNDITVDKLVDGVCLYTHSWCGPSKRYNLCMHIAFHNSYISFFFFKSPSKQGRKTSNLHGMKVLEARKIHQHRLRMNQINNI